MKRCKRCRVYGWVQGVFYRGSTQRQARALGVTGWARNLGDGSVEVLACGEDEAVERLCAWLWEGPSAARVDRVDCHEEAFQPHPDFTTR